MPLAKGFAWRLGHTRQRDVTIEYPGDIQNVPADANGNSAFISDTQQDGPYDMPEVVH